jgi:hypothetical protein
VEVKNDESRHEIKAYRRREREINLSKEIK